LIVHRAAWVLPIAVPPIRDGWVAVDGGRIVGVGGPSDTPAGAPESKQPEVILPGLVNAHVHLELSWMRGAVRRASSMPGWASQLMSIRGGVWPEPTAAIAGAVEEARSFGTALVGDVTNTLSTYHELATHDICAAVFFEQLGFRTPDPAARAAAARDKLEALASDSRLKAFVGAHAPYSVSPGLLSAIHDLHGEVVAIHLAESEEEVRFLMDGTGAWRRVLENLGVWDPDWVPPRCGPVEYLERLGLLDSRLLAAHGVQLTDVELSRLSDAHATLVTCPRSNVWTGAGPPPIQRFYDSGVRLAVGTDSLASVADLNVFSELAALRAAAPAVAASRFLESATRTGAEALGFAKELGTISPGKRAKLIAVRLPSHVDDVEEYLVGGIQAADIRWLEEG
jgi:aminodeoxyfutalosine deaminase